MIASVSTQTDFYREFLMSRGHFNPRDYGVDMDRDEFMDQMVEDFGNSTYGQISIDELLLRPRSALGFCEEVRAKHGYFDIPDDLILRAVLNRRK